MAKVQVQQGWLEGEQLVACVGNFKYYSFKGVPYALPPVGKLRFKAPQPPTSWEGVRSAKQHGPICPQKDIFTNKIVEGNEDCLYLNVYTPNLKPPKPLTVMVFIHGGGYQSGSGDVSEFGPDFLVQHEVVLVTINYRLGALGFICLDTLDVPGNAGLKDQSAALRWIQQNIRNFGGDPNNVTVFGESAGSGSSSLHVMSPMSKGLFNRAILMSGVPFSDWSLSHEPAKRAFQLGRILGLDTDDPEKLLDFLQNLPAEKLLNAKPCIESSELIESLGRHFHYTPVVEKVLGQESFLSEILHIKYNADVINDVDILMGYTSCEMLVAIKEVENNIKMYNQFKEMFLPKPIWYEKSPKEYPAIAQKIIEHYFGEKTTNARSIPQFVQYFNDITLCFHIHAFLNNLVKTGNGKRYLYKFGCNSGRNIYGKNGEDYGIKGEASHMDDLVYLFDPKYANLQIDESSKEFKLVNMTCSLFTNFAKYGTPTPDNSFGVEWPVYNLKDQPYGNIGDNLTIGHHLGKETVEFWTSIYQKTGVDPLKLYY